MLCRRCATTAKAAPALSKTMTMPSAQRRGHLEWWQSLLFFKVRQKFVQDFTCDQSWIAEFGLITADSDEKRLHQNNGFQFRFQYQNRPILSTVYSPIACCNPNIFRENFEILSVHKTRIFLKFPSGLVTYNRGSCLGLSPEVPSVRKPCGNYQRLLILSSTSTHYQTSSSSQAKWNQPFRSQTRHVVRNVDSPNLLLKPFVDAQSVVQYRTALLNGEAQISSACTPTD